MNGKFFCSIVDTHVDTLRLSPFVCKVCTLHCREGSFVKCPDCGVEVESGAVLCPNCGAKLMRHLSDAAAELLARDVEHHVEQSQNPIQVDTGRPLSIPEIDINETEDSVAAPSEQTSESSDVSEETGVVQRPAYEPEPVLVDEQVKPRTKEERKAQRARIRTMRRAERQGTAPRGNPHLHVHDNDQAAAAAPVRSAAAIDDHRKLRRVVRNTVAAMLGIFAVLLVLLITWDMQLWGGKNLPDVRGMSSSDASSALAKLGYSVTLVDCKSDDSFGLVLDESPDPGKRTSTSTPIVLGIGTARSIPDIVGTTKTSAEAALKEEGFTNIVWVNDSENDSNYIVTAVNSSSGDELKSTTQITVTLSANNGEG